MKNILVTGASGYIASHCIAELLKNGFAVRGSLRNAQRQDEVKNAIKTEADISQLEFCELDLLNDTGWDEAVSGCDYVMHVASPLLTKEPNDENEIIFITLKSSEFTQILLGSKISRADSIEY